MKLLLLSLVVLMFLVASTAFAKPKNSPEYQCKHVGIPKVKPFKKNKSFRKFVMHPKPLLTHARYESKQQF